MSFRSARKSHTQPSAEGYASAAGSITSSSAELRRLINETAAGTHDHFEEIFAQLSGTAWAMAICSVDNSALAQDITVWSLISVVDAAQDNELESDPVLEVLSATRRATNGRNASSETKKRWGRKQSRTLTSVDEHGALAFAALPADFRVAMWLMEVQHLSSATVGRLTDSNTKEVESNLRQARMGFRRYYVEALPREGMGLECSTALDQVPDYTGGRLTAGDTAALEQHFARCSQCRATANSLQMLEGRLIDAMPAFPEAMHEHAVSRWNEVRPPVVLPEEAIDLRDPEPEVVQPEDVEPEPELKPESVVTVEPAPEPAAPVAPPAAVFADDDDDDHHSRAWWLGERTKRRTLVGSAAVLLAFGAVALVASLATGPTTDTASDSSPTTTGAPATTTTNALATTPTVTPTTEAPTTTTASTATPAAVTTTVAPSARAVPRTVAPTTVAPTTAPTTPPTTVAPSTTSVSLIDLPAAAAVTTTTTPVPAP